MPSAIIPTSVATGMRRPRIHGTPPICIGLIVMRVNFMSKSYPLGRGKAISSPPFRAINPPRRAGKDLRDFFDAVVRLLGVVMVVRSVQNLRSDDLFVRLTLCG